MHPIVRTPNNINYLQNLQVVFISILNKSLYFKHTFVILIKHSTLPAVVDFFGEAKEVGDFEDLAVV